MEDWRMRQGCLALFRARRSTSRISHALLKLLAPASLLSRQFPCLVLQAANVSDITHGRRDQAKNSQAARSSFARIQLTFPDVARQSWRVNSLGRSLTASFGLKR